MGRHRIIQPVEESDLTADERADLDVVREYADRVDTFHERRVHVGATTDLPAGWSASWSRRFAEEETDPDTREGLAAYGTVTAASGMMFWFRTSDQGGDVYQIARIETISV